MNIAKSMRLTVVGAVAPIITVLSLLSVGAPQMAAAADQCSSTNSVIPGGVSGVTDLKQKYTQNPCGDVQQLYSYFGITSASQFTGMVAGHVDTANNIYVDTQQDTVHALVASDAITAGRDNVSNKCGNSVAILGGKFYKRPPCVSFASGTLAALIKMNGDTFQFAVITSCGNAVIGKPVTHKPQSPATTTTKTKTTVNVVNTTVNVNNNSTTVNNTSTTQAQPAQLPNTGSGAGSVAGLFAAAATAGTFGYRLYLTRKLR